MKVVEYALVLVTNFMILAMLTVWCGAVGLYVNLVVNGTIEYIWPLAFGAVCGAFIWARFIPKEMKSFDEPLTRIAWYFKFWVIYLGSIMALMWLNSLREADAISREEMVRYTLTTIFCVLVVGKLLDQLGNARKSKEAS